MSNLKNIEKEKYIENEYIKITDQSITSNCDANSLIKKDVNSSSRLKKKPRIRSNTIFAFQVNYLIYIIG